MYEHLPERKIACLDMRSFYASCAAVFEGLDVLETPIAIIGNKDRKGSIVLAASPPLKSKFGVKTGARLFEIPDIYSLFILLSRRWAFLSMCRWRLRGFLIGLSRKKRFMCTALMKALLI